MKKLDPKNTSHTIPQSPQPLSLQDLEMICGGTNTNHNDAPGKITAQWPWQVSSIAGNDSEYRYVNVRRF